MDTPSKQTKDSLPEATEFELVKVLLDPILRTQPFHLVCKRNQAIFGEKNSALRKRVKNRRHYLLNYPGALERAKISFLVSFSSPISPSFHQDGVQSPIPITSSTNPFLSSPSNCLFASSPSSTTMSDIATDATAVFKHQLHLYEPWKNPDSILVLIGERAKFDDTTLATRVNIYVPIPDIVDFYDGLYRAYIHVDDYGTICLDKPSIIGYLRRKASTVQDGEMEDHKEPKIVEQHKIVAVSCKKKGNERQNRCRLELKLPNGMTASNAAYNGTVSGLELKIRLRRVGVKAAVTIPDKTATNQEKTKDITVEQAHFFGVVSLLIDGTQVASDDTKSSTREADALAELLGGTVTFTD
jgi:hypothetical protein